jgi:hypothetical protein
MRLIKPAILLIVLLLGGLACVLLLPSSWWPGLSTAVSKIIIGKASAGSVPQSSPPAETKESVRKRLPRSKEGLVAKTSSEAAESTASPTEPVLVRTGPRFPVASEIQRGATRTAVLAIYGKPNAAVTAAEAGHIRERFIYVDEATGSKTFVLFLDGRVSEVGTVLE